MRAEEIASELRNSDEWLPEKCVELCRLAGMEEEWKNAGGDSFESVLYKAAEKLKVDIL